MRERVSLEIFSTDRKYALEGLRALFDNGSLDGHGGL